MDALLKEAIMDQARDHLLAGYHCSEGILLAVGSIISQFLYQD